MMDEREVIHGFLKEELILFKKYLHQSVQSDNPHIGEIIDYLFRTNGKQLRPILVLLAAKVCGKVTPETYHGAVTVELLHTASLVHDDVIDKSDIRRGKGSVNAVFDNTKAVLIGDYLLSSALSESIKTNSVEIIRAISRIGKKLSEGELDQLWLANQKIIDEKAYFGVIDKKTASLISACTFIGAMTAGAEEEVIRQFARLGRILGICFQIRDDIFDYYNDDVGKPTGNDIREGKITLPLIYALQHAPETVVATMMQHIERQNYSDKNIGALLHFAKTYGGIDYAFAKIETYLGEAQQVIDDLQLNAEMTLYLRRFLFYFEKRKY